MRVRASAWTLLWLLLLTLASGAGAHSPYLDQEGLRTWIGPDGRRYQLGMLLGDGIFGPDPGRPVVLDDGAKIVAVGPRADDGYSVCYTERNCFIILSQLPFSKAVPEPTAFRAARIIDFYPEHEKETYGFSHRWLEPQDYWTALTVPLRRAPQTALMATLVITLLIFGLAFAFRLVARAPNRSWKRVIVQLFFLAFVSLVLLHVLLLIAVLNGFYLAYVSLSSLLLFLLISAVLTRQNTIAS